MSRALAIAAQSANSGVSEMAPSRGHSGPVIAAFRKIFTQDARKTLARLLGLSTDGAKNKLEGKRTLSLDEFATMLRTPAGFTYLTAVMSDSTVQWWRVCAPLMEVAEVQAMQLRARRKFSRAVRGALNADADLTAACARADALLVQDEDFHRPHADAVFAMARVQNRAGTAARKGQRR